MQAKNKTVYVHSILEQLLWKVWGHYPPLHPHNS